MNGDRQPPTAAAIYTRISRDAAGLGLGVARQEEACRALAAAKGWAVAEVYTDNDLSAYSGKARPAYERLAADLDGGRRDGVLVVDIDRLTRSPAELERFIDLADAKGAALANVSGDVDLSTSDGRFKARIMGAVARQESERKSERIRREREQTARAGKPHGGPRPYGFEPDKVSVRPGEAAVIVESAARVLAGEPVRAVARDLAGRGVLAPNGAKPFTPSGLRSVLTGPRIAGLRQHRPGGSDETTLYPAVWAAILDRDTWEALRAALAGAPRGGRPASRLLSGIARCGRCHGPLYVSWGGRRRRYTCPAGPGSVGCGRISVAAAAADEEVTAQVLAALAGPSLARWRDPDPDDGGLGGELAAAEDRMESLAADYADGLCGRREWLAARSRLAGRVDRLRETLTARAASSALAALPADPDGLRVAWDAASVEWRRALLAATVELVTVDPVPATAPRRFDPDRIRIVWRG